MSSNKNKLNFRQNSLTYNPPAINHRRNSLVKQTSEDLSLTKNSFFGNEIKITVNTKCKDKNLDFPPPKIAWDDEKKDDRCHEPIIARRCPENRKPMRSLKRQSSVDQDSILSCKEDIINKLRLLLKDDADISEKPNLNIYLNNQNSKLPRHDVNNHWNCKDLHSEKVGKEEEFKLNTRTKKNNSESPSTTSLFQFRKNPVKKFEEEIYSPKFQDKPSEQPNIIVTHVSEVVKEEDQNNEAVNMITDTSQPIKNITIRPTTAKSRRELFGNRTNSAFNSFIAKEGNIQRPPLQRSSSAPIRPEHAKSKFLATKRKLKSNKKRDLKSARKHDANSPSSDAPNANTAITKNGTEIITMVSLVSPASSDIEEISEIAEEPTKSRSESPLKTAPTTRQETVQKTSSLKKIVKQVSFQHSSIHAIRSFSAGFPGRKNSVVSSMMLGGSLKRSNTVQKKQEKSTAHVSAAADDGRVPKRRLLRSHSAHMEIRSPDDEEIVELKTSEALDNRVEFPSHGDISTSVEIEKSPTTEKVTDSDIGNSIPSLKSNTTTEEKLVFSESKDGQQFFTSKEEECWNLYRKMSDKGVNVNYDTLLRGMLTPTEYRNRRQSLAACASLVEEYEDSTANSNQIT